MTTPFFVKYQVHFPDIESLYTYSLFEPFTLPINSDKIVNIKNDSTIESTFAQ